MPDDFVTLKEYVCEMFEAHRREHARDADVHKRELELSDNKFAKANEVREQIDRERGSFATKENLENVKDAVNTLRAELADFRGKWSIIILGLAAVVSVVAKIISDQLGIK
jgi:hypothetical protein